MFKKFELIIASRYLRLKNQDNITSLVSIFALIGIMLGVATLIVVMSVMNGYRIELMDRILGINGHVNLYPAKQGVNLVEMQEKLSQETGVKFVFPIINSQAMVSSKYNSVGGMIRGMQFDDIKRKEIIANSIVDGDLNNFSANKIVIGEYLARSLSVRVGDQVQVIVPKTNSTILGKIPKMKSFEVGAIFNIGMYEYDSSTIFMDLNTAQIINNMKNRIDAFEIQVESSDKVDDVIKNLRNKYSNDFLLEDWRQMNSSFFNAIEVERSVMFLILTLIILVASFNIISSMTMLVNEKNKQIAILRTIGVSKNSVMKIFFICGSSIGVVGTILGLILGLLFSLNIETIREFLSTLTGVTLFDPVIYFLSTLPTKIELSDVINIISMSLSLSFLATIFPAYKASKKDPAEAIRYE